MDIIRKAILDSSPDFYSTVFEDWPQLTMRRRRRLVAAIAKYLLRSAGNPIPYGLFAGVAIGSIDASQSTNLTIQANRQNLSYLSAETARLVELGISRTRQAADRRYMANGTLHTVGDTAYYVESHRVDNEYVEHSLSKLPATSYLRSVISLCLNQAHPFDKIKTVLLESHRDLDVSSAEAWISEAIAAQILIEQGYLSPYSVDPLRTIQNLEHCRSIATEEALAHIERAFAEMQSGDAEQFSTARQVVTNSIENAFGVTSRNVSFHSAQNILADGANIAPTVLRDIPAAAEMLRRIQINPGKSNVIGRFCEQFSARFGEAFVPLLEAINEEYGIALEGDQSALDEPLLAGRREHQIEPSNQFSGSRDLQLIQMVEQLRAENKCVLELSEAAIHGLEVADSKPLPPSFSANLVLGKRLGRNRYELYLKYINGPSGLNTASRFCRQSPELAHAARRWAAAEDCFFDGAVIAEISHLTGTRADDVLVHPSLRHFNIDCGGFRDHSSISDETTIPLSDLLIGVTATGVILWSRRLETRVIPRATSAHNYIDKKNHPVYKFLCCLQDYPYSSRLKWQWGLASNCLVLPRVTYKSIVVSRARWLVTKTLLNQSTGRSTASRLRRLLHDRLHAPRHLVHVIGDQEFVVDLASVMTCRMLIEHIRKRGYAVLEEAWPRLDALPVHDGTGQYTHDFIVPFSKQPEPEVVQPVSQVSDSSLCHSQADAKDNAQHMTATGYIPGSRWLYYELYGAVAQLDQVLLDLGRTIAGTLFRVLIDQWFFIRYNIPAPHLRLRLRLKNPSFGSVTAQLLLQPMLNQLVTRRLVWRVTLDTYLPEVMRYGGPLAITLAEEWFFRDSVAQLGVISALHQISRLEDRWKMAVYQTHQLLDDFVVAPQERPPFLRALTTSIAGPKATGLSYRRWLGKRFTDTRESLASLLFTDVAVEGTAPGLSTYVNARSQATRRIVSGLRALDERRLLSVPVKSILGSFIHMQNNRLLRSAQREQEVVVYELLARLYLMKQRRHPP